MCRQRAFPIFLAVAVTLVVAAQVNAGPVTMSYHSDQGQTRIFRGEVTGPGLVTVAGVTVIDDGGLGGADGVFSGFDLDFIVLADNGNWNTTGDRVAPLTAGTTLSKGTVTPSATYVDTPDHPGVLFGLNADDSIDFTTATLGTRDAEFKSSLEVDTSNGWLSLGRGGVLTVAFPETLIGDGLYLFLGEVGLGTTEFVNAAVSVCPPPIPVPGAILLAGIGTVLVGSLRRRRAL